MSTRRTQSQLADVAEAKLRKEKARTELASMRLQQDRIKLKREATRSRRQMLSIHRAAEQNRFTNDWTAPATSADSEMLGDMPRIVARARQLVRDDPIAKSVVRAFRRNVVGTGITPIIDKEPYRDDWYRWANDPAAVDVEKKRTLLMIQQWCIDEFVAVGEAFVVRWIEGGRLRLQCYEFEQLDSYKLIERETGNEVRHGIEVDQYGAAVAYHFWKHHPNDVSGLRRPAPMTLDSMRIPAQFLSHIFDPERVRQTHGVSRLRTVLRKLRDLSEYDAAQLRVARAEASIGLLIKGGDDGVDPLELDGLNVAYIEENEDITPFTPSRPGGQYDPFVKAQASHIAAGAGTSLDQVLRTFEGGSFSSKRQASIEDRREFLPLQMLLITQLCGPIIDEWVGMWSMQNVGRSGVYFMTDHKPVVWQGQGWEWVDPEAQGKGIERKMRLGLTSRTREASLLGTTVEQLDAEIASDGTLDAVARASGDARVMPAPDGPSTSDTPTTTTTEVSSAT